MNFEEVDAYPVPSFLAERISSIHNYDLSFSENLIKEAKRMLFISAHSMQATAPSEVVDHAWHEMLMFTKWYRDYCSFIGAFIHHTPTPPQEKREYIKEAKESKDIQKQKETPTYTKTKELYKEIFKIEPNPKYWP